MKALIDDIDKLYDEIAHNKAQGLTTGFNEGQLSQASISSLQSYVI